MKGLSVLSMESRPVWSVVIGEACKLSLTCVEVSPPGVASFGILGDFNKGLALAL